MIFAAYDKLYDMRGSKDDEKEIYKLARTRGRETRDKDQLVVLSVVNDG